MNDRKHLKQLHDTVSRYCLFVTKSTWDAEDLAQETWLKAIETLKKQGHQNPEAFLLRVAKNQWIDQSRRKAVFARILKQEKPEVTPPEQGLFEMERAFFALVNHLSPLQLSVFLLRDVFGYSTSEAAKMVEKTEGAVKAALRRARKSLALVRDDLETENSPLPNGEEAKAWLRAIAVAYEAGEIDTVIDLIDQGVYARTMVVSGQERKVAVLPDNGAFRRSDPTCGLLAA
ncbi:RNA polymerase sigma factor [Halalkalibacterium halodurans]|jgi:RNA polymerase sigma-70 factor (ECF subfamily)|uniref:RNA polymerase subunit sigma n=1 Tax=Halalkalibacterium halodurans TaxID=86665 RepID=A0A0M0KH63_ALKHA|nr:RNA polymerase sigma factor [Halalkalibacterium halodurans]MED3645680.1 RNA polymerase sigma factor [Halalkalibacterium halodurans]TPE69942.1 RNA polymerase sigma factor [Halalkalibacterium halodurans]